MKTQWHCNIKYEFLVKCIRRIVHGIIMFSTAINYRSHHPVEVHFKSKALYDI